MAVISKQEQYRPGRWYTWVITEGFNTEILETGYQITEQEAQAWVTAWLSAHQYDSVPQAVISIYDYKEVIREAVAFIKTENPSLAQWNAYLSSLLWSDALAVRWFLAMLARELSQRKEIDLSAFTEAEVLARLKPWIISTPARRLAKIFFNE